MIQFTEVSKKYTKTGKQAEVQALKEVTFAIEQGDICGMIGYSGAGKSTLLRMINGLEMPTSGEVTVMGRVINRLRSEELRVARQQIGMIFQHFHLLWSRTVRENIAFPLEIKQVAKQEREKKVDELLRRVGLLDRADAYPAQLSGGQKQRVGIARAIATEPSILLCDEATSALDPATTGTILDLLKEINQELGITIVLVTHEVSVIHSICKQMVVMDQGVLVEQGRVAELFQHPVHPLTKAFVSNGQQKTVKGACYRISLSESVTWQQLQQFAAKYQISIELEPIVITPDHQNSLIFQIHGDTRQIKRAEQAMETEGWHVEVITDAE